MMKIIEITIKACNIYGFLGKHRFWFYAALGLRRIFRTTPLAICSIAPKLLYGPGILLILARYATGKITLKLFSNWTLIPSLFFFYLVACLGGRGDILLLGEVWRFFLCFVRPSARRVDTTRRDEISHSPLPHVSKKSYQFNGSTQCAHQHTEPTRSTHTYSRA